jgi:prephenate dehydratase
MRRRVAFLGGAGAFSEEAAQTMLGADWSPVPCADLPAVAAAVTEGKAEVAVLPVENSIAGGVEGALDEWRTRRLLSFAQCVLKVRQCLFVLPGVAEGELREVWSHPQALAQCAPFLRSSGWTLIPTGSTVAGAERIALDLLRHVAVLGSPRLGEKWGLHMLRADVQAAAENFTRFVACAASPLSAPTGADQTTLALEPHGGAAGLSDLLVTLQKAGVTLLRLQASPIPAHPWRQVFVVDVQGHREERPLAQLLPELETRAERVQWLGSHSAQLPDY